MSENLTQQLPDDLLRQILVSVNSLGERMTALEERVDRRLQETRPIWEAVLSRLDFIEARMTVLETRLSALETRIDNLELDARGFPPRREFGRGDIEWNCSKPASARVISKSGWIGSSRSRSLSVPSA